MGVFVKCVRECDFGVSSDVLTRKRDNTDHRYFQSQSTEFVNFPWIPVAEEIHVTVMSVKTVESSLPPNGFGVPDIYMLNFVRRTTMPTDCSSTLTETMGKKLVRTRV